HAIGADLVQLVDRYQSRFVQFAGNPGAIEQAPQNLAVIQADSKILEAELLENIAHCRQLLDLDDRRRRSDCIDVALVELAESASRRPIRSPDGLNLVALEN